MKPKLIALIILSMILLTSCSNETIYGKVVTANVQSPPDVTDEYLNLGGEFEENTSNRKCFDVTPQEFKGYDFRIFQANSFLYVCYGEKLYRLGTSGTSMVCTDLNKDGMLELYYEAPVFTGIYRGWLKKFDFATLETENIDKTTVTSGFYQIVLNDEGEIQAIEIKYLFNETPYATGKIFYTLGFADGEYTVIGNEDYEREASIRNERESLKPETSEE